MGSRFAVVRVRNLEPLSALLCVQEVGAGRVPRPLADTAFLQLKIAVAGCGFSTGSFDHFCLALDDEDYVLYIDKLEKTHIPYQTYCHEDMPLKQLWLLDPNGVRVELNFIK